MQIMNNTIRDHYDDDEDCEDQRLNDDDEQRWKLGNKRKWISESLDLGSEWKGLFYWSCFLLSFQKMMEILTKWKNSVLNCIGVSVGQFIFIDIHDLSRRSTQSRPGACLDHSLLKSTSPKHYFHKTESVFWSIIYTHSLYRYVYCDSHTI